MVSATSGGTFSGNVTFGAGIGANNLTGLTRQQQFFYSGF